MALVVKDYGNGSLGDVSSVTSTINSYARVTAVTSSTITINTSTQITGAADFTVGAKILLHVSATTSSSYKTYLGCWMLANITATSSGVLTLDADPTKCIPSANLAQYYVQAIAVAQYKNLTLNSGTTVTPPVYNATNFVGGIVAIMCSDTLKFNGGHISLTDKGIPTGNSALRPTTNNDPTTDTQTYAGWENSDTRIHFMLNCGDGAAFIIAKTMVCSTSSRIGNTATRGYQFYRGSSESVTYNETAPSNVTNVGGSTILVAAETIQSFTPYMFAKYRSSSSTAGAGICRCYIASETKLRNDEGLYAYDCISDKGRMKRMLGIRDYGNGSFGDMTNVTTQLNNYAKVTAISGNKVTYTGATTAGLAPITTGALVMIHWNHKNSTTVAESGRFYLANVLEEYNGVLTLDRTLPSISTSSYACQVVSIPQAKNFTLSTKNEATPIFNGTQGGICAIAVSETCNLNGGGIITRVFANLSALQTTNRSSFEYGRTGLAVIGNAQDSNKLPIGEGYSSIFILASNLVMNTSTRLGTTTDGQKFGGGVHMPNGSFVPMSGHYRGQDSTGTTPYEKITSVYTSGANGHYSAQSGSWAQGGYGGGGQTYDARNGSRAYSHQGAHIMVIAQKITGFNQYAISTGGVGMCDDFDSRNTTGANGGAGYGGGCFVNGRCESGAYNAGGGIGYRGLPTGTGGSSGWAFVYCNEVVNQDTSGTVLAN